MDNGLEPQPYPSGPLDSSRWDIRLVHLLPGQYEDPIQCTLSNMTLCPRSDQLDLLGQTPSSKPQRYETLSYVWGPLDILLPIDLNGFSDYRITKNLEHALRRLRLGQGTRTLWVDAICINQYDASERARQVKLMDHIYENASDVLVWLGDAGDIAGDKLEFQQSVPNVEHEHTQLQVLQQAIRNTSPRWWDRAWIVQEFVKAYREPLICFGRYETSLQHLQAEMLNHDRRQLNILCSEAESFRVMLAQLMAFRANNRQADSERSILHFWESVTKLDCLDARDKVYSLFNLLPPLEASVIEPDYIASVGACFARATFANIHATGKLHALALVDFRDTRPGDLPSWAIDFTQRNDVLKEHRFNADHFDSCFAGSVAWTSMQFAASYKPPLTKPTLTSDGQGLTVQGSIFDYVAATCDLSTGWSHDWHLNDEQYAHILTRVSNLP